MKKYIVETGTNWVISQVRTAANDVFAASITGIEIVSAITRRVKGNSISQSIADKAIKRFKRDFDKKFIVIDLTPKIIQEGISLAQKHGLRGYDTVQFAVALNVKKSFITSRDH